MLVALVVSAILCLALVQANDCAKELESTVYRPKVCGINYFKKVAKELNGQVGENVVFEGELAAQFCLRFSHENKVGLSIIDAQGFNLCTFNNPTANLMGKIPFELNYRVSDDRYEIYDYYRSLLNFTVPPVPPANSSNLDAVGLSYVYTYVYKQLQETLTDLDPYIVGVLDYIKNYTLASYQDSVDLKMNQLFAYITSSVAEPKSIDFMTHVLTQLSISAEYLIPGYLSANTIYFLSYVDYYGRGSPSLTIREQLYNQIQTIMMLAQGSAGIVASFSQFVPVNVDENSLCQYAYNLPLPYGKLVRIILSQSNIV